MMKLDIQRFGYVISETTTESNINVANNTSDVTTTIKGTSTSSYKQNANWTITIDGTGYGGTFNATTSDNNRIIATRTKTITHSADGSKTISYGGTLDMTGTSAGFLSVSGSKILTKLPRASYPTLVDFIIPNAFTIVTNRASANFTHTLTLKIAGSTILTRTSVGASVTITPSESEITALYTALANAYVLPYSLVTQTYDGATLIGTTENTANCFVNPDTNKPIFTAFTYAEDDSTVLTLTSGSKYLKNFSNVKATISSSNKAVGQNSASIVKYIMTIGSQTTEALYSSGDVTLTIAEIDNSTITIDAIDSRGLRTTVSYILPYLEYTVPSIASSSTQREDGIGTTTYLAFQGAIYNGNFGNGNNIVKYFGYRVKGINDSWGAQTWNDITSSFNAKVTNTNGVLALDLSDLQELHENGTSGGFTQGTRFDIQIKLSDGISTQEFNYIIGSTNVLDGKFLDSNYKDTSGDYHIGLGGLPHEDFIVNITTQPGLSALAVNGVAFEGGGGGTALTKATGSDIITGTDDAKYVTAKAIEDSYLIESSNNTIQDLKSMTKAQYDALGDKTGLIVTTDEVYAVNTLSNGKQRLTSVAGSNGDYNLNTTIVLATDIELTISFPTATVSTSNARLSIDNGATYKNIKLLRGSSTIPASLIQNKKYVLYYNGTDWIIDDKLVAYYKFTTNDSSSGAITVDLNSDGGEYDITFTGLASASRTLWLLYNGIASSTTYSSQRIYGSGTTLNTSAESAASAGYCYTLSSTNKMNVSMPNGYPSCITQNVIMPTAGNAEMLYYSQLYKTQQTNITSLTILTTDTTTITSGSEIKIYKK